MMSLLVVQLHAYLQSRCMALKQLLGQFSNMIGSFLHQHMVASFKAAFSTPAVV